MVINWNCISAINGQWIELSDNIITIWISCSKRDSNLEWTLILPMGKNSLQWFYLPWKLVSGVIILQWNLSTKCGANRGEKHVNIVWCLLCRVTASNYWTEATAMHKIARTRVRTQSNLISIKLMQFWLIDLFSFTLIL